LALWYGWLVAYVVSALLMCLGTWRLRLHPAFLWLTWGMVLYVTFVPGPISAVRFRIPVVPLLVAVMVVGAIQLHAWRRSGAAPVSPASQ
jgi:hypothetical protein